MYTLSTNRILERQQSANHYFVIAIIGHMFTCDSMVAYIQHFVFFSTKCIATYSGYKTR
jgi:hypothetical protein